MFYILCYGPNHYAGGTQGGVQYLESHPNLPMDFLHSHKGTIQECSLTNLDTCICEVQSILIRTVLQHSPCM